MDKPSRLRYVAAAFLGVLGVGSFVGIVAVMTSGDAYANLGVPIFLIAGLILIACAWYVLSDAFEAWALAGMVTVVLLIPAIVFVVSVRGAVWRDPVGLVEAVAAFGMVVVIVARRVEARRSRNAGNR